MRLCLASFIAVVLGFGMPSSGGADEPVSPVEIVLPSLEGGTVDTADYKGSWLVLNYWATWCAPCRKEIPELSALNRERDDVSVLGLAFEDAGSEVFTAFLEDFDVSYPILMVDVYGPPAPFGAPRALPTTHILDTRGYPVKTFVGPVTREQIEQFLDSQP